METADIQAMWKWKLIFAKHNIFPDLISDKGSLYLLTEAALLTLQWGHTVSSTDLRRTYKLNLYNVYRIALIFQKTIDHNMIQNIFISNQFNITLTSSTFKAVQCKRHQIMNDFEISRTQN